MESTNTWLFTLLDGPPFVAGSQKIHAGHALQSVYKDIICRRANQQGKQLSPVCFITGLDCHGVPVEGYIEREKGVRVNQDAATEEDIAEYCRMCLNYVTGCIDGWYDFYEALGRQVVRKNYMSADPRYIKACWGAFETMYNKDLIYVRNRVLPYSVKLGTSISNSECVLRDTVCTAMYVMFETIEPELSGIRLLVWTTTPWTLYDNMMVAVGSDVKYFLVCANGNNVIVSEHGAANLRKLQVRIRIIRPVGCDELVGTHYRNPLNGRIGVVVKASIDDDLGSGLVHIAPAYGEIDYDIYCDNGGDCDEIHQSFDKHGQFRNMGVSVCGCEYEMSREEVNKTTLCQLIDSELLLKKHKFKHLVKFCERTEQEVMYRLEPALFVRVTVLKDRMLELVEHTEWSSETTKNKFKQWITDAHDWNISRSRIWGCPIPLYFDGDETEVSYPAVGVHWDDFPKSIEGEGSGEWCKWVFDCWFESGCAPFASTSCHGFEFNQADVICEGSDQTRGWFYTMSVIGVALFDRLPYKRVVATGLVLSERRVKLSKSLDNFLPVMDLLKDTMDCATLRLYLTGSRLSVGEPLMWNPKEFKNVAKNTLLMLRNSCSFYSQYTVLNDVDAETNPTLDQLPDEIYWMLMDYCDYTLGKFDRISRKLDSHRFNGIVDDIAKLAEWINNTLIAYNKKALKRGSTELSAILQQVLGNALYIIEPIVPRFVAEQRVVIDSDDNMPFIVSNPRGTYDAFESLRELVTVVRRLGKVKHIGVCSTILNDFDPKYLKLVDWYLREIFGLKGITFAKYARADIVVIPNVGTIGKYFKRDTSKVIELIGTLLAEEKLEMAHGSVPVRVMELIHRLKPDFNGMLLIECVSMTISGANPKRLTSDMMWYVIGEAE